MNVHYDVVVVGGGLVGASVALGLSRVGKRVALLEGHQPSSSVELTTGWDARIYAISPANRRFLESLSAWPDMSRIGTIATMDVRGDAGGRISFSASDAGAEALAWIAENRWVLASLWQQLGKSNVECMISRPLLLEQQAQGAKVTLEDGLVLSAALVIGADGANSWVREQVNMEASTKSYGQSGVVANFACELPHNNIARQWFLGDSVLAWLPMAGNCISMVWSTSEPEALLSLSHEDLCEKVAAEGGYELGALSLLTAPAAFPLRLIRPHSIVAERVVLLGDAAHTVHPLAGQGVNLGFQDAEQLIAALAEERDTGNWMVLRRYERSRRESVRTMQLTCDSLYELFHVKALPGLSWIRNTGLSLTNRMSFLKRQLARHAVGF